MSRVRFPVRIRLDAEVYENRELRFHLVLHAHARFSRWPEAVADALWASLMEQHERRRVELYAACLMPDHLHLLVRPQEQGLLTFIDSWKSWTTHEYHRTGARGVLWQPGMWDRTIRGPDDFATTTRYIVRNPVTSGFVAAPADWPRTFSWYTAES